MSKDDLDGVAGAAATEVAVDPEYAGWDESVPEARVNGLTIPAFGYYVVKPFKGALRDLKPGTTPSGRIGVKVVEGPGGAVDSRLFDDLYLGVSTEKQGDEIGPNGRPIKVPKTAAEIAKSTTYFQHTLNRLAQALGLSLKRPVNKTEGALETYLTQFDGENTPLFVVEIGVEQQNNGPRNRIKWDSARHPNEPAADKKLAAAGKTALDEAREQIALRNKIEAAKAKAQGSPANGHGTSTPAGSLD